MPAIRPKTDCPKKKRNRDLAAQAVNALAELEQRNPESAIYDFIDAARAAASAVETWFTPGVGSGERA